MPVAAVAAAATIGGAVISSRGAKGAASTQARAADAASERSLEATRLSIDYQREAEERARADLEPWRTTGQASLGSYITSLGLPQGQTEYQGDILQQGEFAPIDQPLLSTWDANYLPRPEISATSFSGAQPGGGRWANPNDFGARPSAAEPARNAFTNAKQAARGGAAGPDPRLRQARGQPVGGTPQGRQQVIQPIANNRLPYVARSDSGALARPEISQSNQLPSVRTLDGELLPRPEFGEVDLEADPGYQFRLEEGLRALERRGSARGGLRSGRTDRELSRYASGLASQEYGAAYGRAADQYQRDVGEYGRALNEQLIGYEQDVGQYGRRFGEQNRLYGQQVDQFGREYTLQNRARAEAGEDYARRYAEQNRLYDQQAQNFEREMALQNRLYAQQADQYNRDFSVQNRDYQANIDDFNRRYGVQQDYLNRLSALAGIGQTSATQSANLSSNTAANVGATQVAGASAANSALLQGANARAAGTVGQANAITNALNSGSQLVGQFGSAGLSAAGLPGVPGYNTLYPSGFGPSSLQSLR